MFPPYTVQPSQCDDSFWEPSLDDLRLLTSRHIVFKLSRPDQSQILLAPLAESAVGWGLCRDRKTRERVTVFPDKADPGYQAPLALCVVGKEALAQGTQRFDMPDFRPPADWVREKKELGRAAKGSAQFLSSILLSPRDRGV